MATMSNLGVTFLSNLDFIPYHDFLFVKSCFSVSVSNICFLMHGMGMCYNSVNSELSPEIRITENLFSPLIRHFSKN